MKSDFTDIRRQFPLQKRPTDPPAQRTTIHDPNPPPEAPDDRVVIPAHEPPTSPSAGSAPPREPLPRPEFSFDQSNSSFGGPRKVEFPPEAPSPSPPNPAAVLIADSRSSLFDKLDPASRAKLDRAIVDRAPRSYRETYEVFQLKTRAVSYTAFYYYARRLRTSNDLLEHARLTLADGRGSEQTLRDVLAQRLLEAALDESASPRFIHRLTDTWRMIVTTHLSARKADDQLAEARKKTNVAEANEVCSMVDRFVRACDRQDRLAAEQRNRQPPATPTTPPAKA